MILTIFLKRDDGAVIYLNGYEIIRDNMPSGILYYDTFAIDAVGWDEEDVFYSYTFSNEHLQEGENIISVEIHQVSESSSDISFDLELIGTSYSNIVLIDSISYQAQITDVSYGRIIEDTSWSLFGEPTPGSPNDTPTSSTENISSIIEFSLGPGFYDSPQVIELFSDDPIYYTLDGLSLIHI